MAPLSTTQLNTTQPEFRTHNELLTVGSKI